MSLSKHKKLSNIKKICQKIKKPVFQSAFMSKIILHFLVQSKRIQFTNHCLDNLSKSHDNHKNPEKHQIYLQTVERTYKVTIHKSVSNHVQLKRSIAKKKQTNYSPWNRINKQNRNKLQFHHMNISILNQQ